MTDGFHFGRFAEGLCCGKPEGCTMTHDGCLYLRHPAKRARLHNDPTVRCQAKSVQDGTVLQCALRNGHTGEHEIRSEAQAA